MPEFSILYMHPDMRQDEIPLSALVSAKDISSAKETTLAHYPEVTIVWADTASPIEASKNYRNSIINAPKFNS